MKKTILVTCAAILGVMLVLPWLTVRLIQSGMAMTICLLLFFCVDPLCAVFTGVTAGKHLRGMWWIPAVNAAAFLAGTWICFEPGETAFLLYAAVYFVLGIAAMILSAWIHK
ncbi:MAG: hypothetical protein J6C42_05530 [Clostridia bacterium]|nr:hypothetical protein [Clostridia bacterium]